MKKEYQAKAESAARHQLQLQNMDPGTKAIMGEMMDLAYAAAYCAIAFNMSHNYSEASKLSGDYRNLRKMLE